MKNKFVIEGLVPIQQKLEIPMDKKLYLIIGPNMSGKTRLMSAIYFSYYLAYVKQKLDNKNKLNDFKIINLWKQTFMVDMWFKLLRGKLFISLQTKDFSFRLTMKPKSNSKRNIQISAEDIEIISKIELKASKIQKPAYLFMPGIGEYYKLILFLRTEFGLENVKPLPTLETLSDIMLRYSDKKPRKVFHSIPISYFIDNGTMYVKRKLPNTKSRKSVYYPIKSEATGVKNLAFITMVLSLLRDGITDAVFIDEPESGLHPDWIKKVAEEVGHFTKNTKGKIFIATHSETFITTINWLAYNRNINWKDICAIYFNYSQEYGSVGHVETELSEDNPISTEPLTQETTRMLDNIWEIILDKEENRNEQE